MYDQSPRTWLMVGVERSKERGASGTQQRRETRKQKIEMHNPSQLKEEVLQAEILRSPRDILSAERQCLELMSVSSRHEYSWHEAEIGT